jgi:signal transduction histidine kinase
VPHVVAGVAPPSAVVDLATGLVLVAVALVAWTQRPESRIGPLIALTGITWLAGDAWSALAYAHRGPLVQTLLTHSSGRTRSPLVVAVIALAYLDGLVPALSRSPVPTLALGAVVVGAAAARFATTRGLEREARLVPLAGATAIWGVLALAAIGRLTATGTGGLTAWGYELAIAITAVALVVDLVSERPVRATTTGLVVDLGSAGEGAEGVRAAIARAVGDPGLAIVFRADGEWVDDDGRRARLPGGDADKEVSTISGEDGAPVAAIVHDPAALNDDTLARSVAAAARLAVANVRLQADVAERVVEVAASRRRLVEAGDVERRRLSEQLRAGAESRLATVAAELEQHATDGDPRTASTLNGLAVELAGARDDLARFAQGVHPQALTDHGLPAALRVLAGQAPVPVELQLDATRMPAPQEAAIYFMCSEALANVTKYANASKVRIAVVAEGARVQAEVTDDGSGGADPAAGSGLRGLADRIEALGGQLVVESERGQGTTVAAMLPQSETVWR